MFVELSAFDGIFTRWIQEMNPTDLRKDQSALSGYSCDAACPNILQQQQKMAKLCILMIITELFL